MLIQRPLVQIKERAPQVAKCTTNVEASMNQRRYSLTVALFILLLDAHAAIVRMERKSPEGMLLDSPMAAVSSVLLDAPMAATSRVAAIFASMHEL